MVPGLIQDHGGKKEQRRQWQYLGTEAAQMAEYEARKKKLIRFLVLKSKHVNEIKDGTKKYKGIIIYSYISLLLIFSDP